MNGAALQDAVLIRSRRRTLAISVDECGQLIVRAPMRLSMAHIQRFITEKSAWIAERKKRAAEAAAKNPPHLYADGEPFVLLGQSYPMRRTETRRVVLRGGVLELPIAADAERAATLITGWYKAQAREYFSRELSRCAALMGLGLPKLRLSSAKTRWGSCSGTGINLSWRLIMAPPEIIEYVVIHELAHMRYADHQAHFWAEVARYLPDYAARRRWLKSNGTGLSIAAQPQPQS